MGWNDHHDPDAGELVLVLEHLLYHCAIDERTTEGEVAGLIIEAGGDVDELTPEQQRIFQRICAEHFPSECDCCGGDIPMSEMIDAMDSGLCGCCTHMLNKGD
jgi:hypothetical protein